MRYLPFLFLLSLVLMQLFSRLSQANTLIDTFLILRKPIPNRNARRSHANIRLPLIEPMRSTNTSIIDPITIAVADNRQPVMRKRWITYAPFNETLRYREHIIIWAKFLTALMTACVRDSPFFQRQSTVFERSRPRRSNSSLLKQHNQFRLNSCIVDDTALIYTSTFLCFFFYCTWPFRERSSRSIF